MHFLMFQMKRAHLRSLAAARPLSLRVGLTPARYDFLQVVATFKVGPLQHFLWRALGISRTSASKMVRRLMELGLVQRRRAPHDRRTFIVTLTAKGDKHWRRTFLHLYKTRPFQRRFERAFTEGERSWKTFRAVDRLNDVLTKVAKHLGDTAATLYVTKAMRGRPPRKRRKKLDLATSTLAERLAERRATRAGRGAGASSTTGQAEPPRSRSSDT